MADSPTPPSPPPPPPSPQNLWRQGPAPAPVGTRPAEAPGKRKQVYIVLALLLALIGVTAAWLCFPSPVVMPSFFSGWIDQYKDPIPVNAWAPQDRKAVEASRWKRVNLFSSQNIRLLRQVLTEQLGHGDKPVVVFLSAYALTRPDGSVHLLPAEANLEDESTWLPLDEMLRHLGNCPSKHKLLILDLRPLTDARLGLLADDVAARAQTVLQAQAPKDPHLRVLWACGPGQHSLTSEELGHSAFAFYLSEGLKGRADGWAPDDRFSSRDDRVSVRELARYVQARVDRWSVETGRPRQTPQFLGDGEDFPLVPVPEGKPAPPKLQDDPAYPQWLLDGWQARDEWLAEAWPRVRPSLLRELEDALLRAERRLRAGADPGRVQQEVTRLLKRLQVRREGWRKGRLPPEPTSLAREVARGREPPDPGAGGLRRKYQALQALAAKVWANPKADEKEKKRLEDETAAFLKEFEKKPPEGKPPEGKAPERKHFELAWLVFEELIQDPERENVRLAAQLLTADPPAPAYRETEFIHRLADWKGKRWHVPSVRQALRLVKEAAQAAAAKEEIQAAPTAADTWLLGWAKWRYQQAEAGLQALEFFFDPGKLPADQINDKVNKALEDALEEFKLARNELREVAAAFRTYEDALVRLPGYAPYLETRPEDLGVWRDAVKAALDLEAGLRAKKRANLRTPTETLQDMLNGKLLASAVSAARDLIGKSAKAGPADPTVIRPMRALLRLPWLQAQQRAELWAAQRKLSARLTAAVLKKEAEDDDAQRAGGAPPAVETAGLEAREKQGALLRARVSLELLRLNGATDLKELEDALARAEGSADVWPALSAQLRRAWAPFRGAAPDGQAEDAP
jgi:hypothetical protein